MKRSILSAAIVAAVSPAVADEAPGTDSDAATLEPVQVTATRLSRTVDEALASVTVIDREEIERLQPRQFTDLVEGRAGVSVSSAGPFGKQSSVRLRGTESDHHLMLIDGVRMGSATTGGASWQFLPPEEIERVEIVRGPRTSIYGSDAIGGVTQVFSRAGREGPPRVNAFLGAGSFSTWEAGLGVAGGTGRTDYSLSVSMYDTEGINVQDDMGDDDPDGYDNTSLAGKVAHRLDNGIELFGNVLYSEGNTEVDTFSTDETDFVHGAVQAGVRFPVLEQWDTELAYAQSRDENENFENGVADSRFDTRRDQLTWRNDVRLGERTDLIAGVDAYEDRVDSNEDFDEDSRYNVGVYSVVRTELGNHDLEGSLRYDDNEQFGDKTTGQVAWGMQATDALRLRASYGTAFKAPTFNDLYWPDQGWFRGNPDLAPEESQTFELGGRYSASLAYVDVAVFETRVDDLIVNRCVANCDDGNPFSDVYEPRNVENARIRGLEIEGGHDLGPWNSRVSLTLLDAEDRDTGNELERRAPVSARFDLDRRIGDLSVGGTVLARGRTYDDASNDERLSGYGTMNLRAAYALDPEWTVEGSLTNLFDRDYETQGGFNNPGRAAFVKLRYQQQR
ncbi:TonB-dependent receptor domain-containing protein [Thioalkalivibrio halophilus]|uniref:TonB-dependent receptor n=1 Tax=Thioalkalivibrio halophilus TaxID=252474 RepID=A0A1V2ZXU8_9GAMM|nr:TonB-dependent receptor [Thioalkalivibrio halophilus]OOC09948.1 TonB-dependent receptor [Thioalkalivibrio halophilus]